MTPADQRVHVVASALPLDSARFGEEVLALEKAGVDRVQWDVMDGRFVPNLTVGPDVVAAVRPLVSVPFEAHLMVEDPDVLLPKWVEAGCETVIVHAEACRHLHRTLGRIADLGAQVGVAVNPATPLEAVRHVLDLVDMLLVMTVNPGFGGQSYLRSLEPKIREAGDLCAGADRPVALEVDGGIGPATVSGAVRAGARLLVVGTALHRDEAGLAHAVSDVRSRAEEALQ